MSRRNSNFEGNTPKDRQEALLVLAVSLPMGISQAQKGQTTDKPWREIKCDRYHHAWSQALARFGRDGLSADFISRHEAFLASGCRGLRDACPRSEREFALANAMTIHSMIGGAASTFAPFACRPMR